jgi:hypothetical protein
MLFRKNADTRVRNALRAVGTDTRVSLRYFGIILQDVALDRNSPTGNTHS